MKVPFKKPSPDMRTGMEAVPHTLRTKEVKDGTGRVVGTYQTVTMAYPKGHPMEQYKRWKREHKQYKANK